MRLVDLNVLIYAVNRDAAHHAAARKWLQGTLNSDQPVALPWVVLLGFLRLTTNRRVLPKPLSVDQAASVIDGWLELPGVRTLEPGPEHWNILRHLLAETGTGGNLTTDAHLAAMAIENGCELCSTDSDFARFPHLRWLNPLDQ